MRVTRSFLSLAPLTSLFVATHLIVTIPPLHALRKLPSLSSRRNMSSSSLSSRVAPENPFNFSLQQTMLRIKGNVKLELA